MATAEKPAIIHDAVKADLVVFSAKHYHRPNGEKVDLSNIMLGASLILGIGVIVYSWKNPLYLILLYVLFLGNIFGQVDLSERLYVQPFEAVRIHFRDLIVAIMLIHIVRSQAVVDKRRAVFYKAISFFLVYLLANLLLKFVLYGENFDGKITPFIRLFSTFSVYYLLVNYLRRDTFDRFVTSCYVLCAVSVVMLVGYVLSLIPLPQNQTGEAFRTATGEVPAMKLGVPNHFFLFFPYFLAVAPLLGHVKLRFVEKITAVSLIVGSVLGLFRMYLFVVVFGGVAALLAGRRRGFKKLVIGTVVAFGLFYTVQTISDAKESGILESLIRRIAGTVGEFGYEEGSAGGRVIRTYAAFGQLMEPGVLFLGSVFTKEFADVTTFTSGDLGLVATVLNYGLPALILIAFIYRRGIPAALASRGLPGESGRVAGALLLFMISVLPGVLFMYNPLESEMWIAVWATFLGTFDAMTQGTLTNVPGTITTA